MKEITTYNNQSVWDLAVQEYGTVDGVKELLEDNPGLSFELNVEPGTVVKIRDEVIVAPVVDYFTRTGLKPATGFNDPDQIETGDFNDDFNDDFYL